MRGFQLYLIRDIPGKDDGKWHFKLSALFDPMGCEDFAQAEISKAFVLDAIKRESERKVKRMKTTNPEDARPAKQTRQQPQTTPPHETTTNASSSPRKAITPPKTEQHQSSSTSDSTQEIIRRRDLPRPDNSSDSPPPRKIVKPLESRGQPQPHHSTDESANSKRKRAQLDRVKHLNEQATQLLEETKKSIDATRRHIDASRRETEGFKNTLRQLTDDNTSGTRRQPQPQPRFARLRKHIATYKWAYLAGTATTIALLLAITAIVLTLVTVPVNPASVAALSIILFASKWTGLSAAAAAVVNAIVDAVIGFAVIYTIGSFCILIAHTYNTYLPPLQESRIGKFVLPRLERIKLFSKKSPSQSDDTHAYTSPLDNGTTRKEANQNSGDETPQGPGPKTLIRIESSGQ